MHSNTASTVRGKVVTFLQGQGYGFIAIPGQKNELFFHWSDVLQDRKPKVLPDGIEVEFEIGQGDKGPVAKSVRVIG